MPPVSASIAALLSLLALIAGAKPAHATATLVTLHDVVFWDGGTASGTFSLNILGLLDPQRNIATTTGSVLGATTYTSSGSENNSAPPADFVVFFSPGFKDGVQFQFLHPLGTVAMDPIVLGGASCEFASFSCQSSPHRDVISGFAESEVVISLPQIPDPGSRSPVHCSYSSRGFWDWRWCSGHVPGEPDARAAPQWLCQVLKAHYGVSPAVRWDPGGRNASTALGCPASRINPLMPRC
jgi:hypothetical protein